jgi:zinc transporter
VISARRHPLRSVDRLRTAVKRGEAIESSVELLDHLLRDQADELQRIVRRTAERLDDIEDEVLAGHHERHGAELARLRRLRVRLLRLLSPEPSALQRTLAHPPLRSSQRRSTAAAVAAEPTPTTAPAPRPGRCLEARRPSGAAVRPRA